MPLRIRRGTDAERLTITPLEGELIYTTDTKLVYVGDGTTVGGLDISVTGGLFGGLLGQNLDLNGFDIVGLGDVNVIGNQTLSGNLGVGGNVAVTGTITAQGNIIANGNITLGNGGGDVIVIAGEIDSNLVPGTNTLSLGTPSRPWGTLHVNGIEAGGIINGDLEGNIRAADSSLAFNASTSTFSGTLLGNVFGNLEGNMSGSVFADDSSLLVDGIESAFYTTSLQIKDSSIISTSGIMALGDPGLPTNFIVNTTSDNIVNYNYLVDSSHKYNVFKNNIGSFTAVDNGDRLFTEVINATDGIGEVQAGVIAFVVDDVVSSGNVPGKFVVGSYANGNPSWLSFSSQGKLGVNKFTASEALDVEGSGLFSGSVTAAAFKGSFVADDSSIIVDGVSGAVTAPTVTASTFVQFPVYSNPTARDAAIPSPAAGMVVFVTDSTGIGGPPKLQANTNGTVGGWVDL